jgi:hypothetical protein
VLSFGDESIRPQDNLYVIGAVALAQHRLALVQTQMRGLLLPGQRRFHWRDESQTRRLAMLDQLGELKVMGVASRCPIVDGNRERARAKCLRELLWTLRTMGATEIVFESRQRHNDQKDRQTVVGLQKARIVRKDFTYRFDSPLREPVLWGADTVAGAVCEGCLSDQSPYQEKLGAFLYGVATAT